MLPLISLSVSELPVPPTVGDHVILNCTALSAHHPNRRQSDWLPDKMSDCAREDWKKSEGLFMYCDCSYIKA